MATSEHDAAMERLAPKLNEYPSPLATGLAGFTTRAVDCWDLEPGDIYVIGTIGGNLETRTVLEVLQRTPMHGALLAVVGADGNHFRSHMSGKVRVVAR